jgi:hypothetical protein
MLIIEAVLEDGTPVNGRYAQSLNPDGLDRAFTQSGSDNIFRIPLWAGESYGIEAGTFDVDSRETNDSAIGNSIDGWQGTTGLIQSTAQEENMHVVLHRVPFRSPAP